MNKKGNHLKLNVEENCKINFDKVNIHTMKNENVFN